MPGTQGSPEPAQIVPVGSNTLESPVLMPLSAAQWNEIIQLAANLLTAQGRPASDSAA